MISTKDLILYVLKGLAAITLATLGFLMVALYDEVHAKPSKAELETEINKKLRPVEQMIHENKEGIIQLREALLVMKSIDGKLNKMDDKLDTACEDISAIKAKQ